MNGLFVKKLAAVSLSAVMLTGTGWAAAAVPVSTSMVVSAAALSVDSFDYTENDDGTLTITQFTGSEEEVTVPATINGKKVTAIAGYAFCYCMDITRIVLPKTVLSVADTAFFCCSCLKQVEVDAENPVYTSIDGVLFSKDRKQLVYFPSGRYDDYTVPDGVEIITDRAFEAAMLLERVILPESVQTIGDYAFCHCGEMTSIQLPSTIQSIGIYAFSGCYALASIVLPDGLIEISRCAFSNCTKLKAVLLPESVTAIGEYAFLNCPKLKTLRLPAHVEKMDNRAFYSCQALNFLCAEDSYAAAYAREHDIPYATHQPEVSVHADAADLYALYSWDEPYLAIPPDYPQSVHIQVTGTEEAEYVVEDTYHERITVSEDGVVSPKFEVWYQYYRTDEQGTTWVTTTTVPRENQEPDNIIKRFKTGTSRVKVYAGGKEFCVDVTVRDYGEIYADEVVDAYIAQNITPAMTTKDKLAKVAQFIADRDYSTESQEYVGLIVTGGGDCWASTDTVITMAERMGMTAWGKSRAGQPGAGSGHMNAVVYDGEAYYEVEAGYGGTAPRGYYVKQLTTLYRHLYSSSAGGYEIIQYDGRTAPDNMTIPSWIDGTAMEGIGRRFLYGSASVRQVTIEEGVKYIGAGAFQNCSRLHSVTIPASVCSIADDAFSGCTDLTIVGKKGSYAQAYAEEHDLPFSTKAVPMLNLAVLSNDTVVLGSRVTVHCAADDGTAPYRYSILYKKSASDKWTLLAANTTDTEVSFTPQAAVSYDVRITAKDAAGKFATKTLTLKVNKPLANTAQLGADRIALGSKVKVRCFATGGEGSYQYAVYYKKASSAKWTKLRGYDTANILMLKPGAAVRYDVRVDIRDKSGNVVSKTLPLTVTK